MSPQTTFWNKISAILREARACLPTPGSNATSATTPPTALTNTIAQFEEFLEHNELELAWDTLAEIAEHTKAPSVCWQKLSHAARLMKLSAKESQAALRAGPAVPTDEAIAAG